MKVYPLKSCNIAEDGLLMDIEIMPSLKYIKQKGFSKSEIPIVKVKDLFDTGAKTCAVDKSVIDSLRVTSHMITKVKTPLHTTESYVYQLIFKIPGEKEYFPVTAVLVDLSEDNHKAIIGRDFLQYCTLVYDGTNKNSCLVIKK